MRKRSIALTVVVLTLAVVISGCGESSEPVTPVACLQGPDNYSAALASYPEDVSLSGGVRISDCLVRNQADGNLVDVGDALRITATDLSRQIDSQSPGQADASFEGQAGYLVGALEAGAEETDGIHATLIQRVESAATNNIVTAAQQDLYDKGLEAGRESG